ncbi:MAG: hypothetical protein AABY18_06855 [Candidatus Thermoplasmatota archaeon]
MVDETPEDQMTVRERRALHAKQQSRKDAPVRMARKAIVPGIIILVIAAIVAGFYFTAKNQGECPDHWHATFDVYVQDDNGTAQRISFRHPDFDLSRNTPMRSHMHQRDGKNQFHFEQGAQCVGVEEAFGYVDVELNANSMTLQGAHAALGQEGTYREEGNKTLEAYVQSPSGEWRHPSVKSILDYQLKDGESILILYGNYTDEQVAQFQAAMALPDSGRQA